jgi:ABC-type glycerol-3-phosphate transport system permease component
VSLGALSRDISAPASVAGGDQYSPKTRHARARKLKASRAALGMCAILVIILTYFPLLLLLSNSLRTASSLAHAGPFSLFTHFDIANYRAAAGAVDPYILNTVIVTALSVAIGVPVAALAAYGFATMKFRGRELLFSAFLGLLLIPWTLTLIPLFAEMRALRLYGNWGALVLPYATAAQPLLVFLDRAFFEGIPSEILMSARVEGATEIQVLRKIVVPLAKPVLLMGIILMAISAWGDYIWPQVVLPNQSEVTISAGLQYFVGSFGVSGQGGGALFAAYVVASVPLLVLVGITMRQFVTGLTSGTGLT